MMKYICIQIHIQDILQKLLLVEAISYFFLKKNDYYNEI